jgi:alcohol dehydrogenase class IV
VDDGVSAGRRVLNVNSAAMSFEFATASRIVFGTGQASRAAELARGLGRRILLVTGRPRPGTAAIVDGLTATGEVVARLTTDAEPTVDGVRQAVAAVSPSGCDVVVAIGGGSVIDTGKAVAALLANGGDPLDYLEVVGDGRPLARTAVPLVAVPTTAGSGAEVTKNAVLAARQQGVKASLRSPSMLPRVALVDPVLTYDMPPGLTAATGLDALAQLVEPYLSVRANPMIDTVCREGMRLVSRALRAAVRDGSDAEAREAMSLASLFGGLALANAGLGAVHGFAGPLGGRLDAPHGALCAALLPAAVRVNLRAVRARAARFATRFDDVARWLTGDPDAVAEDAVAWLEALGGDLAVPGLSSYGFGAEDVPALLPQARASSSMRGNPVELTDDELAEILEAAR